MTTVYALIKRNTKLFFKDKGMFFTSLITPLILLVLYATFLGNVYRDSFMATLPSGAEFSDKLIDGLVGGQLVSSILAVSCVTVSFCANFLMVQDKVNGSIKDLRISPVKPWMLSMGYYAATLISTLIICFAATGVCLAYIASVGWYMSAADVALLLCDVLLLSLFGTALSSVINFFLSTQGQISAVGTVVSSCYGFICGAYMPISSFAEGLQTVIMLLPGTYGTALVRNHAMGGALSELEAQGLPAEGIKAIMDAIDCNIYFVGNAVDVPVMYAVMGATVAALVGLYILMNAMSKRK